MTHITKRPPIRRVIDVDTVAYTCLYLPLAFWLVFIWMVVFGDKGMEKGSQHEADVLRILLLVCVLLSLTMWPALLWRLRTIRRIIAQGIEVQGQILDVTYAQKINAFVKYTYTFNGRPYTGKIWIANKKLAKALNIMKPVAIIVNSQKPNQTLIRDFYIQTAPVVFGVKTPQKHAHERPVAPPGPHEPIQTKEIKPPLRQIISVDTFSSLCFLIPVLCWGALFAFQFIIAVMLFSEGMELSDVEPTLKYTLILYGLWFMAIVSPPLTGLLLVWRLQTIRRVFSNGVQVRGKVTDISFLDGYLKGHIQVKYAYTFQGQLYESKNTVHKKQGKSLDINRSVRIIVNADKPKQALIRHFYIQAEE